MSSIKSIVASNPMPVDLAQKLGVGGIAEILAVLWQGYEDLKKAHIITDDMHENTITQEWFIRICERWYSKSRASRINLNLHPIQQYEDDTLALSNRGSPPTIDFCFRSWNIDDGYFGAECKNLYDNDHAHVERYVNTGVKHYVSGRYGSKSSTSAMVGYVLSGEVSRIVEDLRKEISTTSPRMDLCADLSTIDAQYKSCHTRTLDNILITIHHLLFDFVA